MKKLYLFFAALLACSVIASAEDIDIVLNVTGADRIDAVVGGSLSYGDTFDPESMEKVTLVDGENTITRPEGQRLYINPKNAGDIFKIADKDGDNVYVGYYSNWFEIGFSSWSNYSPYTVTCTDEATYRKNSVTIKMDDCSKVKITRVGDAKVFEPESDEFILNYNEDNESVIRIQPRGNSYALCSVKADGTDVQKKNGTSYYEINLADKSGDEPVYVENIDVNANFPEGTKFKTTITLDGPEGLISYIKIDDEDVTDLDAYLTEDGFEVDPNTDIRIGISEDYKFEQLNDNGNIKTSLYGSYPIENIDCDHNIVIKGREYKTFEVKFNVTGVDGFTFEIEDKEVELVEGENTVTVTEEKVNCKVIQKEGWDIVTFTNRYGYNMISEDDWYWTNSHYVSFYLAEGDEYTIVAKQPEQKTVTVTMDDCSLVSIGVDGNTIKPEENTVEVSYTDKPGARLSIQPRSFDGGIYQVTADGKDIERSTSYFYVDLVDNTGDEPVYVQNINVTAKFPDDLKYKTTINLDGPAEMIKYIRFNGEDVENVADYLTEDGFEVEPLTKIAIGIDDKNFDITELSDNGEKKYSYSQLTIDGIVCDHDVVIKGTKLAVFEAKFNITGAEGLYCEFNGNEIDLVEGENIIKATKKNKTVIIKNKPEWEITSFTDSNDKDILKEDWYWGYYNEISVEEGVEYTVVATKIARDNQIVVYFEDWQAKEITIDYFQCCFDKYTDPSDNVKAGYNLINFRDEDSYFKLYCSTYSGAYENLIVYKNDEIMPAAYDGAKYREDEDVANGDVYKVFFDNDPESHTVTFDLDENVLDGYEVKKDIIAEVDATAPVTAVGPTRFTIAPVSRAAEGFTIKIGDTEIEPVDGVYSFETSADTTVEIKANKEPEGPTTGIDSILTDDIQTADVYNLQGIRIARDANAAQVKALRPGLYIVKGAKVLVK